MSGDVGDDLGEFGRFGHGGLAVEFFGQLVALLPELLDFGGQFGHPWRGGLLVYGSRSGEIPFHGGVGFR